MKPFNLEEAISGKPLITRNGRKVLKFHYFDLEGMDECIVAVIEGFKSIYVFHKNGRYFKDEEDINDLCMAEPETWINVYYSKTQDKIYNSVKYNSEEEAKENIVTTMSSYLTTVQIS
jgi:inorganic pyrophosphatase